VTHGANDDGAKLPATLAPRRQGLGANDPDAMPLYLGADDYGAKIRVLFFKIFPQGAYLKESFEKMAKKQKK
jgi:hypothetical protein